MTAGKPLDARFSSARERRLWTWTIVIVVAIFSTLGLARTLADVIRERELLDATFGVALLLVGATIGFFGIKRRPGGPEIAVILGVTTAYLLVFLRMAIPEERTHLIEYSILAVFIYEALRERSDNGSPLRYVGLLAFVGASLVGVVDELIQAVLPSRVFDPIDIAFNVLASGMAVTARGALVQLSSPRDPSP